MSEPEKTVLCVEDNDLELKARKRLFESAGLRVLEAQSRTAALDVFRSSPVDAVVLDYWLAGGGGNGTAVAEEIKHISPATPVLMLSGYGPLPGEETIVDAWIVKSRVAPEDLVREVERLIEQRLKKDEK